MDKNPQIWSIFRFYQTFFINFLFFLIKTAGNHVATRVAESVSESGPDLDSGGPGVVGAPCADVVFFDDDSWHSSATDGVPLVKLGPILIIT